MLVQRGDLACCIRCAGPTSAERLARRAVLTGAVHAPPATDHPAPAAWPVVTGTVLDTSPQIVTLHTGGAEQRVALLPGASVWRGRPADPTALETGDLVVVRLLHGPRGVADRIWANTGRVTGLIVARDREGLLVDEGRTRRRQAVVIPPHAAGRLQVRFPRLEPGYLLDVIGLRRPGYLEALIPATSQPAYQAGGPAPGPASGRVAGSVTWHEPACAADEAGVRYPAIDPGAACLEHPPPGTPCPRLPYLSVGSLLRVRNECTGLVQVRAVSGCAATAQAFCDRCVTCGTSPRGRVACLPMAGFAAIGGDLAHGCFNATVSLGRS
jgi:hypothetical protein